MSNITTSRTSTQYEKYGMVWDRNLFGPLEVELWCYLHDLRQEGEDGRLTKWDHYRNAVDLCWNTNPNSHRKVVWNEWSEDMARGMIYNKYCSLAGSASSGKSDSMAVYGIINYLGYPQKTKIILSSTTLEMAQLRVWRSVSELWRKDLPGKMVQSKCAIQGFNMKGQLSSETGLKLIPAATGGASEEINSNFMGIKQDRLIVLLDELTELPMGVLNACYTNLDTVKHFELKAASNPNLYTDPFGVFSKPKGGWDSVTEKDSSWDTARGKCLRFDAEQSPNIKLGRNEYPWLPKPESMRMAREEFGERSRFYFRMYKAFWFPDASDETIFSEGEIISKKADTNIALEEYDGQDPQSVQLAGSDPSFTQGGDRFPIVYGQVVQLNGDSVLEITGVDIIKDDISSEAPSRSHAAVDYMQKFCLQRNIAPEHFAYDMTGAGIPFRDIVVAEWSSMPMGVNFGGFASKLQISPIDKRKGCDVYANRVSELWGRVKGLIREGRIRGLTTEIIQEMCERRWSDKMITNRKLKVESKVEMKKRGMRSPDISDALMVLVELAVRSGLMGEMESVEVDKRASDSWVDAVAMHDVVSLSDTSLTFD